MIEKMTDGVSHWPIVRDKPGFLHRLMVELAGDTRLSLEGDLSRCRLAEHLVLSREPTAILKRNTIAPKQDFVVVRLTHETIDPIFEQVVATGLSHAILHVQIERNGILELGAYDNFHRKCVMTGPGVSSALLNELKNKSVLSDFKVATPQPGAS